MSLPERKGSVLAYFCDQYFLKRPGRSSEPDHVLMARHLGVSPELYRQWECGQAEIPDDKLNAALAFIGLSREDFDFHVNNPMKPL